MNYIDLDLNLLKTFLAVYENKSILLASKKLYISQPAVTNSIKKLENYLGGKLFVRTSKGVVPTNEGEEFNKYCYNAMKILTNGINKFVSLSNLNEGSLNIGSSSTIIRKILLPFIEFFNQKYPKIIITITDANSEKLVKYLKNGSIDLAILNMPVEIDASINATPLIQTHDCFIASQSYSKQFLTKEDLKNEKLILQKRPSSNRDYFENMCALNDISLNPSLEIGSFGLITDFVSKNIGVAYTIKEFVEDDIKNNRVKIINTDFISQPRDISVLSSNVSVNSFASEIFMKELNKYFKN